MSSNDVVIMTGGGTAGHLSIIQAVKGKLFGERRLVYVGSIHGLDQEWFKNDPEFYREYFLDIHDRSDMSLLTKLRSIYHLLHAMYACVKIIKELQPKVVFSVGGYSAAPMAYAAKRMKIPLVIHEQNAYIERFHKRLRSYSSYFISSYIENSPIHAYPIKTEYFQKQRIRNTIQCILFLGGLSETEPIDALALSLAKELDKRGIKIIHQTQEEYLETIENQYKAIGIHAKLVGYSKRLSSYMNEADLAIARSGASTLWELSANGLPTVFIPYSNAIQDHQYHNAKFLEDQDLAWIMREDAIDQNKIFSILDQDLSIISTKLLSRVEQNGDIKIAMLLKEF
jgi:UDP-N-acetylglucosamine--N-acetylmuramyl-(pentapeptide) pyrophosphoryl-undecaprenol N-acetylglucosamine transferase